MSRTATRTAVVVRARRYVSAPEGVYPDPVEPGQDLEPAAADPAFDPAATVAVPLSLARAAAGTAELNEAAVAVDAYDGVPEPVAHEDAAPYEMPAEEATGEFAGPLSAPIEEPGFQPAAAASADAPVHDPFADVPRATGAGLAARLAGGVVGGLVGAAAGLALLALAHGSGLADAFEDPAGLWARTDDPVLLASAVLVAGGFTLFGYALPKGRSRSAS